MLPVIRLALRGFQIFWTLLLTALIGNAIANDVDAAGSARAAVNFAMFVAVICWLGSLYGLACELYGPAFRPLVALPLDAACTLLGFIGAVVLSAKLRVANCADLRGRPADYIALGAMDDQKRCREIQGGAAFLWFLFGCYAASLFFTFREARSGGGLSSNGSMLSTRTRPSMAQVGV